VDWSITLVNAAGALITGASALTSLKIRRVADDYLLDWDDLAFKASGWGHSTTALVEVSATNVPGLYSKTVVEATWSDGDYQGIVRYVPVSGNPVNGDMLTSVRDGKEIEVRIGDVVEALNNLSTTDVQSAMTSQGYTTTRAAKLDDLDATVSSRSTVSAADVRTQADAALTAYDPPTAAELTAAVSPLATAASIAALNNLSSAQAQSASAAALTAYDAATGTDVTTSQGVVTSAISGLNNLSSVQAQAASAAALVAYDPPTNAELSAAVAPLATSLEVAALPTDADVQAASAAALTAYDAATGADISALNNLSSAQAQAAASAALTSYDPPTNAELSAAVLPLATATALATVDGVVDAILVDTTALDARVPTDPADQSAVEAAITAATGPLATTVGLAAAVAPLATTSALTVVDGIVDSILADTAAMDARLPSDPADESAVESAITAAVSAIRGVAGDNIEDVRADIAALNDLSSSDVDTQLSGTHGSGAWGGGASLTAQQVRDAMKLAPTVGAPAAGSVDLHLDTIEGKTNNLPIDPADQSAVEAAITASTAPLATSVALGVTDGNVTAIKSKTDMITFSGSNVQARVADKGVLNDLSSAQAQAADAAALVAYDAATGTDVTSAVAPLATTVQVTSVQVAIAALYNLSITDVQTALITLGYTGARAIKLDNLNATISGVNAAIAVLHDLSSADVQAILVGLGYTSLRAALLDHMDADVSDMQTASQAAMDLEAVQASIAAVNGVVTASAASVEIIRQVETGRWQMVGNQMIFYADDGMTPILTFDLFDEAGVPAMDDVFQRRIHV
jgi:hypothetical protein